MEPKTNAAPGTNSRPFNILDYGQYKRMPYLVMSYLPGGTLEIDAIRGLNISITTTAKTDDECKALLAAFRFPFKN